MLFLTVVAKLTFAVPVKTQEGAYFVSRFFRVAVTDPPLFAIGVALTPWDKLMDAFHWKNLVTISATIATLMTTGWFVGRWVNLDPIEAAVVNACQSGPGGTGEVAIPTAANRMQLMPFAQIATRIGGALTVTLTLLELRALVMATFSLHPSWLRTPPLDDGLTITHSFGCLSVISRIVSKTSSKPMR